jgi:L-methionine (R)-S-oxide reductase
MFESLPIHNTKEEIYCVLLPQIEAVIGGTDDLIANLANVAAILKQAFRKFHWVGFYRTTSPNLLTLGPFQGPPACVLIPFEQGVCGSSARTQKTVLVPDVEKFPGHIACSILSKSEIVVPLVHEGRTQLILDIDSDELNAFDKTDQKYLELIVATIAKQNFRNAETNLHGFSGSHCGSLSLEGALPLAPIVPRPTGRTGDHGRALHESSFRRCLIDGVRIE